MKELPILMNGDAVRAILDGRKTQTRRPIRPQPTGWNPTPNVKGAWLFCVAGDMDYSEGPFKSSFGAPGDRLWAREAWGGLFWCKEAGLNVLQYRDVPKTIRIQSHCEQVYYKATDDDDDLTGCWVPSIHMPRWVSRITLEVARVWVEQVQEISEDDAKAEGITVSYDPAYSYRYDLTFRGGFTALWDSIYAAKGFGWNDNPWVFGCEFKVLEVAK